MDTIAVYVVIVLGVQEICPVAVVLPSSWTESLKPTAAQLVYVEATYQEDEL